MNRAHDNSQTSSRVPWRLVASILLGSTLVTSGVLYQQRVETEWSDLPSAVRGDTDSMQVRLAAVEDFMERYPVWLGSQRAMRERTRLSTELQVLRTQNVLTDIRESESRDLALGEASENRRLGVQMAENGDFAAAIIHFERALETAPEDWDDASQVERDIAAIENWLEEGED